MMMLWRERERAHGGELMVSHQLIFLICVMMNVGLCLRMETIRMPNFDNAQLKMIEDCEIDKSMKSVIAS